MQANKGTKTGGAILEASILNINRESAALFELVKINTSRGTVECRYYKAANVDKAVIMLEE